MREIKLPFDAKKSVGIFVSENASQMSVLLNGDMSNILTAFSVLIYQIKIRVGIPYETIKHIVDFTKINEPYYQELCKGGVEINMAEFLRQVGKDDC